MLTDTHTHTHRQNDYCTLPPMLRGEGNNHCLHFIECKLSLTPKHIKWSPEVACFYTLGFVADVVNITKGNTYTLS